MTNYSEFLERYYYEDILELVRQSTRILYIDYNDLVSYDLDATDSLFQRPDEELSKLNTALYEYIESLSIPSDDDFKGVKVSIRNVPRSEIIPVHLIGSEHVGKFIALEGRITKSTQRQPRLINGAFQCLRCEHIMYISQDGEKLVEPFECENDVCGRKSAFRFIYEESTVVDEVKFEIQELYENLNPGQPVRNITVVVRDDLIESIPVIGSQIIISGIPRVVKRALTNSFIVYIEANGIESIEPDIDLSLTEADKIELKKLAADSDIFWKLIESTAPTVLGYPEIKLSLLASAVSGDMLTVNGRLIRGYLHVVICGDPSTAKSVLSEFVRDIVPRAQYSAGKGASAVGLTVSVVKDELTGGYIAQAGALVLADKGVLIIDELDKLSPEDIQSLNTALESCKIYVNKGGLNQTFNARCAVVALLNPKHIRFDDHESLANQVKIPPDTLSRFDLVFMIKDVSETKKDRLVAESMGKLWQQAVVIDTDGQGHTENQTENPIPISIEILRKYLSFAKLFEPMIPDNVRDSLIEYFMELRKDGTDGRISSTYRDINSLFRLVRCVARLRLSDTCSMGDVVIVKWIYETSRKAIIDPTSGLKDTDILQGTSKSQRERIQTIRDIIRDLQGSKGNGGSSKEAYKGDILSAAEQKGIPKDMTADALVHLKKVGDIIETDTQSDSYRLVK